MNTIQEKPGKCFTGERYIVNQWTEYCAKLYNSLTKGNGVVLDCPVNTEDSGGCSREAAVKSMKKGKLAGVDNIPAELMQAEGETVTNILTAICNQIWQT